MINFHVTHEVYDDVEKEIKTHEYREYKKFWKKKLKDLQLPVTARIVKGYSDIFKLIQINWITVIDTDMIENEQYRDYIKTEKCFDIEF